MIIDITHNLLSSDNHNKYIFNPSVIHLENNIYLGTYRYIQYNVTEKVHPWKMWWNGFDYFKKKYPALINKNEELEVNMKLFTIQKYRKNGESDLVINLDKKDNIAMQKYIEELFEYDSTGIFLFELNGENLNILAQKSLIFKDMNQDTRLQ